MLMINEELWLKSNIEKKKVHKIIPEYLPSGVKMKEIL